MEYVVLMHWQDPEDDKPLTRYLGRIAAPTREKAEEALLEQTETVPKIPMRPGDECEVRLVPRSAWGRSIPVRAAQRVVLDRGA